MATTKANITNVIVTESTNIDGAAKFTQTLEVQIISGEQKGNLVTIENVYANSPYEKGDVVVLDQTQYYVTDHLRTDSLVTLFFIFALLVELISRKWGINSILGMFYSFFIILKFILPNLLAGRNPLFIVIVGAMLISPVTFAVSHGVNKKTFVALISTFAALLITGILAEIFIKTAHLTGFGSEEAYFLQIQQGQINMQGILLAGIIIGALGVLDDVTITQAGIVSQLKNLNKRLSPTEVFTRAMQVGHDHIAATVNTLVLVYTGSALPLLLLLLNSEKSFSEVLNQPILAEEVVSTLVGSIGLISAVPITTLISALILTGDESPHTH